MLPIIDKVDLKFDKYCVMGKNDSQIFEVETHNSRNLF